MKTIHLLATSLMLSIPSLFSLPARACNPNQLKRSAPEAFELGTDGPADPATLGYTVNHFALIVNDIEASMHFYGKVLGMRHIFTYHASPAYEIAYMSYSHGGKNGTGFRSAEELCSEKANIEGLLELLYFKDSKDLVPSTKRTNTFSHVGLVVPDVRATQARMEKYGVNVVKRVDEPAEVASVIGTAYGLGENPSEANAAAAGIAALGFNDFLIVTDPHGNLLEIQNQV